MGQAFDQLAHDDLDLLRHVHLPFPFLLAAALPPLVAAALPRSPKRQHSPPPREFRAGPRGPGACAAVCGGGEEGEEGVEAREERGEVRGRGGREDEEERGEEGEGLAELGGWGASVELSTGGAYCRAERRPEREGER